MERQSCRPKSGLKTMLLLNIQTLKLHIQTNQSGGDSLFTRLFSGSAKRLSYKWCDASCFNCKQPAPAQILRSVERILSQQIKMRHKNRENIQISSAVSTLSHSNPLWCLQHVKCPVWVSISFHTISVAWMVYLSTSFDSMPCVRLCKLDA